MARPVARPEPEGSSRGRAFDAFLRDIRRFPLLSREEEHALAVRFWTDKDPAARKRLIESNLRLVVTIANNYAGAYRQNLDDLVQEGHMGLLCAVDKYDPNRDVRFATYASHWIRCVMLRSIMDNYRLVKIGSTLAQRRVFFGLHRERRRIEAQGIVATADLLAAGLGVDISEIENMQMRLCEDISIHHPPPDAGEDCDADWLADAKPTPEMLLELSDFRAKFSAQIDAFRASLRPMETAILLKRIITENPVPQREVARSHGISHVEVRRIEARLLQRLKQHVAMNLLGGGMEMA